MLNIEKSLSTNRVKTFRDYVVAKIGTDNLATAMELYAWNASVSSALLLPLHIYEVTLRNAVAEAISLRYGANWPHESYFVNSLPNPPKNSPKRDILNVRSRFPTVGKMIPELKFSFWEGMLTSRHDSRIWNNHIKTVFPLAPAAMSPQDIRIQLHDNCNSIRNIRNRIAHHEHIFKSADLANTLPFIEEGLSWRCHDTNAWLKSLEQVSITLSQRPL